MSNILEIKKLTKWFGDTKVLDNIDLKIEKGKVHGIVGANGSGKSTLMNILFGKNIIKQTGGYEGEILYDGKKYDPKNSSHALGLGIGMIHQELALLPEFAIYENIKLMRENTNKYTDKLMSREISLLDKESDMNDASVLLKSLGIDTDVKQKVNNISGSLKQFVEICRELDNSGLKIILFDEPTATLGEQDSRLLLETIKKLSQRGLAVIFISHRLEEILEVCDQVTVLRDGKVISSNLNKDIDIDLISYDMMGKKILRASSEKIITNQEKKILELKNFSVSMKGEDIKDISIDVYESEIIGVTSLSGHGKLALGYGLMGSHKTKGEVIFQGNHLNTNLNAENVKSGMIFLSDERKNNGLLLSASIMDNIIFTANETQESYLKTIMGFRTPFIDKRKATEDARDFIESFGIKCISHEQRVSELSGGNQQKVCLARVLATKPKLLIISEPTRGIDIAAKEKVLELILKNNQIHGITVIVISSELDDLRRICNRIAVLSEGKLSAVLNPFDDDLRYAHALSGLASEVSNGN